jgi:hypothetical protein
MSDGAACAIFDERRCRSGIAVHVVRSEIDPVPRVIGHPHGVAHRLDPSLGEDRLGPWPADQIASAKVFAGGRTFDQSWARLSFSDPARNARPVRRARVKAMAAGSRQRNRSPQTGLLVPRWCHGSRGSGGLDGACRPLAPRVARRIVREIPAPPARIERATNGLGNRTCASPSTPRWSLRKKRRSTICAGLSVRFRESDGAEGGVATGRNGTLRDVK